MALVTVGLLIALGIAEMATRIFSPHPRHVDFLIPDDRVGSLPRPDYHGRAANMFGEYDIEIRTNHEGFRDSDFTMEDATSTRIAFLGDSFTFGEQVEESETFVRSTEKLLRAVVPAAGIRCMNFGVGGYDTHQELLCYEIFAQRYDPDVVVLMMYVHNDLIGNAFYLLDSNFGRPYFRPAMGGLEKVAADPARLKQNHMEHQQRFGGVRWYHHFHLYNLWRLFLWENRQVARQRHLRAETGSIQDPARRLARVWQEEDYRNYRYYAQGGADNVVTEADRVTELLLQRLERVVREHGARFCVALLPARENLWPDRWAEYVKQLPGLEGVAMDFERPYKRVRHALPEAFTAGVILDLRETLRPADSKASIFFGRDHHYNKHGHSAVAEGLAGWLASTMGVPERRGEARPY